MTERPGKIVVAFLLIGLGVLLLLNNLEIVRFELSRFIFRWPTILMFIGLMVFLRRGDKAGIVLLGIGGFFFLVEVFSDVRIDLFQLWPAALMVIGILLIRKRSLTPPISSLSGNHLNEVSIFGGNQVRVESESFQGGALTAIFGGSTIDLRKCTLASGSQELNIFTLFGGSKIIVPEGMKVSLKVNSILGEMADKRRVVNSEGDRILNISGTILLGGCELMN